MNKYYRQDDKYYISDDAYVFSAEFGEEMTVAGHKHDFVELVYMLKGKCVHTVDGVDYPAGRGDLVIVNYNQTHSIRATSAGTYVNILVKPEYINRNALNRDNAFALLNLTEFEDFKKILDEKKCKVAFSGEERNRFEGLISQVNDEIERKKPGHELAARSMFNLILITVFRKMSLKMERAFDGISGELLQYIVINCGEKLTLEKMAGLCNYNTSYFSRLFKSYAGMSFTAYLKKERMKKAEMLIKTTDMKISDIAAAVGYTDSTKFFADFKNATGETPLKFRKSKN